MGVMTVVFGRVAGLQSEGGAPYAILVFAGGLPWMFFSSAVSSASQSLVGNANLISKVYFPRLIVPASAVVTASADFLISLGLLGGLMAWHGFMPGVRLLALPVFAGMACAAALGPGLLLTALNVRYRDFRYVIPFLVQFGLYVSPVGFSSTVVREKLGESGFLAYSLNPMVGVIDGFRWAVLGGEVQMHWAGFLVSLGVTVILLVVGVTYFRRTEKSFADVI